MIIGARRMFSKNMPDFDWKMNMDAWFTARGHDVECLADRDDSHEEQERAVEEVCLSKVASEGDTNVDDSSKSVLHGSALGASNS